MTSEPTSSAVIEEASTDRMVWVPEDVIAYVVGRGFYRGEWISNHGELEDEREAGATIYMAEEHPDGTANAGSGVIRVPEDATVSLVDYLQLSATVEELSRQVAKISQQHETVGVMFDVAGAALRDRLPKIEDEIASAMVGPADTDN